MILVALSVELTDISFDCSFFLNRFPVCCMLDLGTPCLVVAVHPCMEWIAILKNICGIENTFKTPVGRNTFYLLSINNVNLSERIASIVSMSTDHGKSSNISKLKKYDCKKYDQVGLNCLKDEILNDMKH